MQLSRDQERIYCGPQGIDLGNLFKTKPGFTVYDFFWGREVYYTHKCRTALRKVCELLELGVGDEVLVPAYNCGSEIDVFLKAGASLQFYRVKETAEVDWEDFVGRITRRTKAALVTHYFGFPQKISNVTGICKEKKIYLIEDCAHALFSAEGKRMLGSLGDMAVFSFPKTIGVPDGGALVINNVDLSIASWTMMPASNKVTFMRMLPLLKSTILKNSSACPILGRCLFSIMRNGNLDKFGRPPQEIGKRRMIPKDYYYDHRITNRGLSEIAKYLLFKVNFAYIIEARRRNYLMLLNILKGMKNIRPLYSDLTEGVCPLYFPVLSEDRGRVIQDLNKRNVRAIAWWSGYHDLFPLQEFSDACRLKDSVLAFPIHQDISEKQIEHMGRLIQKLF